MKILLSEELPICRQGMLSVLKNEGHNVDAVNSKNEFCNLFSNDYDIIILDLDFIGDKSIELAQQAYCHSNAYQINLTRLVATYKDEESYFKHFFYLFNAQIKKQFSKEKLLQIINKECINVEKFNNKRNFATHGSFYQYGMV
jgi:two-component SAPR family response regulator